MTQPTVAQYLEFANLQMAAEAFYGLKNTVPDWQVGRDKHLAFSNLLDQLGTGTLTVGNEHASKFPSTLAKEFAENWEMVAHIANTGSGFSGSLFRAKEDIPGTDIKEGDLTLSFRSTEFIEDAVRDNRATNTFEIKEKGFSFSQMADMEQWVQLLVDKGLIGNGKPVNVTGYSLGAHLATVFNLLHQDDGLIKATYTFNGAGVGKGADGIGKMSDGEYPCREIWL